MKIVLLGDSTLQTYSGERYPQTGWGQVFPRFVRKEVEVLNFGKGGASTKSFYEQGYFRTALNYLEPGDHVLIQFGHNDQKPEEYRRTEPFGTYQEFLRKYISEIRAKKAYPILLSSVYRRHFDENGNLKDIAHGEYPRAMREVAEEEGVPYIDICALTENSLRKMGDGASRSLYMNFGPNVHGNYPEGSKDDTHLSYQGAYWIAEMVAMALKEKKILTEYLL